MKLFHVEHFHKMLWLDDPVNRHAVAVLFVRKQDIDHVQLW